MLYYIFRRNVCNVSYVIVSSNPVQLFHILDTRTGAPAEQDLCSVTIVSKDGTLADGLSTSLFVMGKDKAIEYWKAQAEKFDVVLVTKDQEIYVTEGLKKEFHSENAFQMVLEDE